MFPHVWFTSAYWTAWYWAKRGAPYPTPTERIYTPAAETRSYAPDAETRLFTPAAETRLWSATS